ncbi:hypothetical protein REPUB_Repub15cG0135900 [Reevesia pubescens]
MKKVVTKLGVRGSRGSMLVPPTILPGATRDVAYRHLNRALAECLVTVVCPEESEAIRTHYAAAVEVEPD